MIKQLCPSYLKDSVSEPQLPPCSGDPREVMSLEQRPGGQDDIYAFTGLLSKDEDTERQGLETA